MSTLLGRFFDLVMALPVRRFYQEQTYPRAAQEKSLRRILSSNKETLFGSNHNFASFSRLHGNQLWKEFRRNVPISQYDSFLPDIELMKNGEVDVLIPGLPDMFSLTSGTTSEPKLCPVNRTFIKELHRQHLIWMYKTYRDHPSINSGKYMVMTSPAVMGKTRSGIPYGAMSGKQFEVQSIPVRRRAAVPLAVQQLADADLRWVNKILFALSCADLKVGTALNPTTLLTIANKLSEHAGEFIERIASGKPWSGFGENTDVGEEESPKPDELKLILQPSPGRAYELESILKVDGQLTPSAVWPELEMIFTWQGGSSSFYLPHVAAAWGGIRQRCLGLRASEGTFSIPLRDNEPSGTLAVGGHVMEFIPAESGDPGPNTDTLLADELEQGSLYRMIITTSGGFYRYDLGDLVEVTGFYRNTPEVAFIRRAGSVLSATGEKVTEDQVVDAMRAVGEDGPLLHGFTLTWEFDGLARYVLAVECAGGEKVFFQRRMQMTDQFKRLLIRFDEELRLRNVEYDAKRHDGRLGDPRLLLLADLSYRNYRAKQAKAGKPEIQIKNPHLIAPIGPGRAPVTGTPFFRDVRIIAEIE